MPGLPSAMQARKAKLEAMMPSLDQPITPVPSKRPVPVMVHSAPAPAPASAPSPPVELNMADFVVGDDQPASDDTPAGSSASSAPAAAPAPASAPAASSEEDENQWKWKYHSLEGNHQIAMRENREMRDRLAVLEDKLDQFTKPKPDLSPVSNKEFELTPEEEEQYGSALPVLNKVHSKNIQKAINDIVTPLQQKIAELEKNNQNVEQRITATDEGSFVQQVKMHVKDFETVTKTPEWKQFTSRPLSPYTNKTIGNALLEAHNGRDLERVVKVFSDFGASRASNPGDAYRAPTVSSAAAPLPDSNKKPMLKWSEREKASKQFRKRQISPEQFQKIADLYREADSEGRIDYNK